MDYQILNLPPNPHAKLTKNIPIRKPHEFRAIVAYTATHNDDLSKSLAKKIYPSNVTPILSGNER